MSTSDTIAAQATPAGRGGVGIIRISGDNTPALAKKILGFLPAPRHATFCQFKDEQTVIDEGIALYFPSPHSFTGEDVLELQGHGGAIVLDMLLAHVLQQGARLARPGEFSERAFLNHKMDLAQAEAVADLINANSIQAAKSAMRSLRGEFSKKIHHFRDELIELRKFVEGAIDFPEEEIDFISEYNIKKRVGALITLIEETRVTTKQGVLLQEGMTVVIAGEPNVGKSSLLNCLSGNDRAIVTDIAGTTRDVLSEHITIDGMPLHVIDTAGLRETQDVVEREGVRRARHAIDKGDLLLLMIDGSQHKNLAEAIHQTKTRLAIPDSIPYAVIVNKIDLLQLPNSGHQRIADTDIINISVKNRSGIHALTTFLKQFIGFNQAQEGVFIARRRHLNAMDRALEALQQGVDELTNHQASELLAENLRTAQQALNEITGEFNADDLLGEIFASFCIGK